jgi:hypothetical protein
MKQILIEIIFNKDKWDSETAEVIRNISNNPCVFAVGIKKEII